MKPPRTLLFLLGVATFFEGFDFLALTQVLPQLRATWGLDEQQGGLLVGVANIGPVLAFFLIRQADRLGRSRVLTWTIAGYTVCGLLSAAAPNAWAFAIAQLFARAFLIAEWATCLVYAAEVYPAEQRGRAIGLLQALAAVGAVVCAGLTPLLLSSPLGWRTVYVVGAIPLLLLGWARRGLPESPRFVASQAGLFDIWRSPSRGRMLQLAVLWAGAYTGTHLALTFWKEYAVNEALLSDAVVGRTLTIAAVVGMPFVFGVGSLLDTVGRKWGAAIIFPITAASVFGAFTLRDPVGLTVSMTGVIFGCSAVLPVLEAYNAELFPSERRGDAFGWSNNLLGRLANVVWPPIVGAVAVTVGWGDAVRWSAFALIGTLALLWWWLPETRGRELEDTARA
jgi:MFS transporter, putative metabolite:H+ symporter